jgi:hypothetical protein
LPYLGEFFKWIFRRTGYTRKQLVNDESIKPMKTLKTISIGLLAAVLALPLAFGAEDKKAAAKPYPFDKCLVTDEKIGADADMKPYVFIEDGQEIKLCCKSCLKDFKKDKATLMKKLAAGQKKAK